jgi:hypothetical protein
MHLDVDSGVTQGDAELPSGHDEWAAVCAKHYGDAVSEKFCASDRPPPLGSLADLQKLLKLDNRSTSAFVMTGHSTGIGVRIVTPLNPRALLMTAATDPKFQVLAFSRGEMFVELVARDETASTTTEVILRFFLLRFHLPCETRTEGCNHADLYTPTIESGWTGYTLQDDEALAGTTLDCLTCHQPNGPGTRKILRMQELTAPWTHFMGTYNGESGNASFDAIHGMEVYGGRAPGDAIHFASTLENLVRSYGFGDQPNVFDSSAIKNELGASGTTSATWQALYDNAVAGNVIPPPYFGADQTDPDKKAAMIAAYRQVMAGTLARDQLPDMSDIMLDSALPAMSIRPKPGLDGRGILVHMCSQCHNSRLDQTLLRARFNVMALDSMSRQEKDEASARLQLPDDDPKKMPPPRFRVLSQEEQTLVLEELAN